MTQEIACITGLTYGLAKEDAWAPLWWVSLIAYFTLPIVNEIIMNLKGALGRSNVKQPSYFDHLGLNEKCFPIVYSKDYNIEACGLEKMHPFDSTKYKRVFDDLVSTGHLDPKTMKLISPAVPDREFLQFVMSSWYLFKLNFTIQICQAVEMPLPLPGWLLRMKLLDPMACATQGSVQAACLARIHGWAINLGGGFHHATHCSGEGFCIYPDITFITKYME